MKSQTIIQTIISVILMAMLIVTSSALLGHEQAVNSADAALSKRLLGEWECSREKEEEGVTGRFDSGIFFVRNGRYNTGGLLSIDVPMEDFLADIVSDKEARSITNVLSDTYSLGYLMSETGEWEIADGMYIQTAINTKIYRSSLLDIDLYAELRGKISKSKIEKIDQAKQYIEELLNEIFVEIIPQGLSDAYEIVIHSETSWSFISESEGSETLCSRPTNAPVD